MTLVLVRKLFRDVRLPLLVVMVLLFLFSAFWVKIAQRVTSEIAPFFQGLAALSGANKKLIDDVVFKGPGKISQAIMGGAEVQYERPTDFLAVELLHPIVLILSMLWAVGRAGAAVSGEMDRGTMELLLSQPVPRNRLIFAHFLIDAITIPLLCLAVFAGTQTGLAIVGPFTIDYSVLDKIQAQSPVKLPIPRGPAELTVDASRQPLALLNLGAIIFCISGLTMAVSAAGRNRWRTIGLGAVGVLGMFSVNVLGQLWDAVAWARPVSAFYYYQPQKVWMANDWTANLGDAWASGEPLFEVPVMAVLLGVGALGYFTALTVFTRRDLPAPL